MNHRTIGRSGIQVSEIVFGAGAVGGILIHKDDATTCEAIRRAIAGGINWIDTAAQYGNGRSGEALGWLLPQETKVSGATPYLSTKFDSTWRRALQAAEMGPLPADVLARLDTLYESDFGRA